MKRNPRLAEAHCTKRRFPEGRYDCDGTEEAGGVGRLSPEGR